jgi:hypothetical protein
MDSRLRGKDRGFLTAKYFKNNSCSGNKYAGYRHIFLKAKPLQQCSYPNPAAQQQTKQYGGATHVFGAF